MTLVVGATGLVGAEVCRLLKAAGEPVRAFVRPGSAREEELRRLGAEISRAAARGSSAAGNSRSASCRPLTSRRSASTA